MATIYEKFPGKYKSIRPYPIKAKWTANLNAGQFVFNNLDAKVYDSSSGDLIVMDGLILAANCDQLVFSQAILDFFTINVILGGNKHPALLQPFPFAAFNQGENFSANWRPNATVNQGQEEIILRLNGSLQQTPDLAAFASVTIYATASVYILDKMD